jgi:hypothetical protein
MKNAGTNIQATAFCVKKKGLCAPAEAPDDVPGLRFSPLTAVHGAGIINVQKEPYRAIAIVFDLRRHRRGEAKEASARKRSASFFCLRGENSSRGDSRIYGINK